MFLVQNKICHCPGVNDGIGIKACKTQFEKLINDYVNVLFI